MLISFRFSLLRFLHSVFWGHVLSLFSTIFISHKINNILLRMCKWSWFVHFTHFCKLSIGSLGVVSISLKIFFFLQFLFLLLSTLYWSSTVSFITILSIDASSSFLSHHVSFQMLWECSVKLYNILFLKTYCIQVLELHTFSADAWVLYYISLSSFFLLWFICGQNSLIWCTFVGPHYTDICIFMDIFLWCWLWGE